jgi:hypothetical protein
VESQQGPQEIKVRASAQGAPISFTRKSLTCNIAKVYENWRVCDEWWQKEIRRDYFRVETDKGLVYDVYHDLIVDQWYLSRIQGGLR